MTCQFWCTFSQFDLGTGCLGARGQSSGPAQCCFLSRQEAIEVVGPDDDVWLVFGFLLPVRTCKNKLRVYY